jgi:Holliday junction resolvase RusA-like endonuclease
VSDKLKEFTVELPLRVRFPRKTMDDKYVSLSMNQYRNWDHRVASTAKKNYHYQVKHLLEGIELETPVDATFQMFKPTRRKTDKSNFYAVISKFFFDSMTQCGCWEDDNDEFIRHELLLPTEVDKDNPRAVITFRTIEEK